MAGSYKKIDYRVRPAKSIERKMLAEAFRKLSEFGKLDSYRYVGFGSLYFTDFTLFHKMLGFKKMISIEGQQDPIVQQRFNYNIPYKCIDLEFGHSNVVLPQLPWDVRSIVWLDYDGTLNKDVLHDITYLTSKMVPGSILLVSVNANIPSEGPSKNPLDQLKDQVGDEKIPAGLEAGQLSGWNFAKILRSIVDNEIQEALVTANHSRSSGAKLHYKQLFNFHYEDGAKMLTVGGILYDEGQEGNLHKCAFNQLDFFRDNEDAYRIDPPLLTYHEMRKIDAKIPFEESDFSEVPVPRSHIEKYQTFYRYFPHFAETEM